jgi:xanthine phosphoribosyltransferase
MEHVTLSWAIIQQDITNLARKITDANKQYEIIVAVTRGGLVPSVVLAHKLKVRAIDTIDLRSYADDHTQEKTVQVARTCHEITRTLEGSKTLIVDDLVDSGNTIACVREILPKADVAVIYARSNKIDVVDFYAREKPNDSWLIFPWEM